MTDQLALARLTRAIYALMVSLLPATATVIGIVILTQIPTMLETVGVALVVAGVALHRDPAGHDSPDLPPAQRPGRIRRLPTPASPTTSARIIVEMMAKGTFGSLVLLAGRYSLGAAPALVRLR